MRGKKPDSRQKAEIRRYGRNAEGRPYRSSDWLVLRETPDFYYLEHRHKQNLKIKLMKK